jgi:glycosyltransferase involved in cell wall biosynthesis
MSLNQKGYLYLMGPTVTVGICVKHCECLIKETLDSPAQQNFPLGNMELIFVDDGIEDKTLSIIKDYS